MYLNFEWKLFINLLLLVRQLFLSRRCLRVPPQGRDVAQGLFKVGTRARTTVPQGWAPLQYYFPQLPLCSLTETQLRDDKPSLPKRQEFCPICKPIHFR